MKFLALNTYLSSLSREFLCSKRHAYASVKEGYPLKVAILLLLARLTSKRLQSYR